MTKKCFSVEGRKNNIFKRELIDVNQGTIVRLLLGSATVHPNLRDLPSGI